MSLSSPGEHRLGAPLRGKNIACLGWTGNEPGARALNQAAGALGARLAWLTAFGPPAADSGQAAALALLGQLYDAIVCADSSPEHCADMARQVGVPVISAGQVADGQWPVLLLATVRR